MRRPSSAPQVPENESTGPLTIDRVQTCQIITDIDWADKWEWRRRRRRVGVGVGWVGWMISILNIYISFYYTRIFELGETSVRLIP